MIPDDMIASLKDALVEARQPNKVKMTDEARYVEQQMIRQERCTKGFVARELSYILAQYERDDPSLIDAIIAYKDKLNKEAANI